MSEEAVLFAVHMIISSAVYSTLIGCMYVTVWIYDEYFDSEAWGVFIAPTYILVVAAIVAGMLGYWYSDEWCLIDCIAQAAMALVTIILGWIFSVKKNHADGYDPDYVAFFVVSGYSVFAVALNALLLLLL